MTTVYFIRHAEPDFTIHNDMERPLSDRGRESCKKVTKYLRDKEISSVFSSPYLRAYDTVKDFAEASLMPVKKAPEFRERAIDTEWIEDFWCFVEKQWQDFDYKLSGGESLKDVQNRTVSALKRYVTEYRGQNIVIGSHGTAISTVLNYYDKEFNFEQFKRVVDIMPFVVAMIFDGTEFKAFEVLNILGTRVEKIYTSR